MFSTCYHSTCIYHLFQASNGMHLCQLPMTTYNGANLIACWTTNRALDRYMFSVTGLHTDTWIRVRIAWKTYGMVRIWWTRLFGYILGSYNCQGKSSIWFSFFLCLDAVLYKWLQHRFYHCHIMVKWRWSFPIHCIHSTIVGFSSCLFTFSFYVDIQSRRSVPNETMI